MNSIQLTEMTHEELAAYAREHSDETVRGLAVELQDAVDNEQPSDEIAAKIIEIIA